MARSYDSRQYPAGPFVEPRVTPTHRGLKRIGAIGDIVPGDDIEVARAIARLKPPPRQKPTPIVYHAWLSGHRASDDPPEVEDYAYVITCTEDQGTWQLYKAELYITTASSTGDVEVQLRRILPDELSTEGEDILAEPLIIDEGDLHSDDSATPYEIDLSKNVFEWKDRLSIDIDAAPSDVRGLSIGLWFIHS